ncbi:hypothetical protein B0T25DRAFT_239108 [Lasiosphaeria hispida]|uniref:Protein Zds1 C-terminal domain-containing protein n=1 Tax=Lasiosphaeria hispida TaxID=260671 RepID=A0AAJ0HED2_9PEZI|nr:hypothetical protein B0T25DRAFT_239108 [Lasiosphaeria hispida]
MPAQMMTSSRPRGDVGGSFASRRGHAANQLSISDPSHHVTEAIGTMYGDDDDSGAEDRPLSFIGSAYGGDNPDKTQKPGESAEERDRLRLVRTISDTSTSSHGAPNGFSLKKTHTLPARMTSQRSTSYEGPKSPLPPLSPNPSLREGSQFPLTNIDNPKDIAQELSNLQALRRLSMDVGNNHDPDLLPFSGMSLMAMPSIAPTGDDDEADPSRLLWVPARVHPELEPTAFKDFLENRVNSMKRRSGDSMLSNDPVQRSNTSNLRRKKSMLSRQIHNTSESRDKYVDGAERLQRQYSLSEHSTPELSIDELVADPTGAVRKLAQESRQDESDIIVPVAPGMGLRRSTRTQYRKGGGGSVRSGDRAPFSKRATGRIAEASNEDVPPLPPIDPALGTVAKVKSDSVAENFSRPTRSVRRQQNFSRESAVSASALAESAEDEAEASGAHSLTLQDLPVRTSSVGTQRTAATPIVPQIIETPPEETIHQPARLFPERSSSQKTAQQAHVDPAPPVEGPPARSSKRPSPTKPVQPPPPTAQSTAKDKNIHNVHNSSSDFNELGHPNTLHGAGATSTSSLTFIPTMVPDERKKAKDKEDTESLNSTKSSGWKWFKSDDKDKKKREKEKEEQTRKTTKLVKSGDNARLDVLQSSIDTVPPKGRESLLLDRDNIDNKLQEERKRESNRKASDTKKEKDGFFGGLFGGKKKADKEPGHKKKEHRPLTPEPPPRQLRPDVDFPWTRFPIIEERAIYRMAHIKLANPRRPLHSQVLLSNFMYSYLAKVQAMHPQLQVPISPQQKRQEEERKRREAEQAQLQMEMERQQQQEQAAQDGNFDFEYHRYGDSPSQHDENVQYVDDAQIYEYEHGIEHHDDSGSPVHQNSSGDRHQQQQQNQNHQGHHQQDSGYGSQGYGSRQSSRGGREGDHYYSGRDSSKRHDKDNDEDGDMW